MGSSALAADYNLTIKAYGFKIHTENQILAEVQAVVTCIDLKFEQNAHISLVEENNASGSVNRTYIVDSPAFSNPVSSRYDYPCTLAYTFKGNNTKSVVNYSLDPFDSAFMNYYLPAGAIQRVGRIADTEWGYRNSSINSGKDLGRCYINTYTSQKMFGPIGAFFDSTDTFENLCPLHKTFYSNAQKTLAALILKPSPVNLDGMIVVPNNNFDGEYQKTAQKIRGGYFRLWKKLDSGQTTKQVTSSHYCNRLYPSSWLVLNSCNYTEAWNVPLDDSFVDTDIRLTAFSVIESQAGGKVTLPAAGDVLVYDRVISKYADLLKHRKPLSEEQKLNFKILKKAYEPKLNLLFDVILNTNYEKAL